MNLTTGGNVVSTNHITGSAGLLCSTKYMEKTSMNCLSTTTLIGAEATVTLSQLSLQPFIKTLLIY